MLLSFTKMHGLGNDFIVIDNREQRFQPEARTIRFLCDRHLGIGCDQLLLIENPPGTEADFSYRIFNADGGEVEQCGNGARCFARYVSEKVGFSGNIIRVQTLAGLIQLQILDNNQIRVNMGAPDFRAQAVDLHSRDPRLQYKDGAYFFYEPTLAPNPLKFRVASMGNPHASIICDTLEQAEVTQIGAFLNQDSLFKRGVNVGFMQILSPEQILLRVYERGAGETLACGSGACAAVVNGIRAGLLQQQVQVKLPHGDLSISWAGGDQPVYLQGGASFVFEGHITL